MKKPASARADEWVDLGSADPFKIDEGHEQAQDEQDESLEQLEENPQPSTSSGARPKLVSL